MAVNKVVYGTTVLVDLTPDTVDASHLAQGYTAHDKSGNSITGTMTSGLQSGVTTKNITSQATSIAFTGLPAQPKSFSVIATTRITASSTRYVVSIMNDGSSTNGTYTYKSGNTTYIYVSSSYFSSSYSNGTLTLKTSSTTNGGYFAANITYRLVYYY